MVSFEVGGDEDRFSAGFVAQFAEFLGQGRGRDGSGFLVEFDDPRGVDIDEDIVVLKVVERFGGLGDGLVAIGLRLGDFEALVDDGRAGNEEEQEPFGRRRQPSPRGLIPRFCRVRNG